MLVALLAVTIALLGMGLSLPKAVSAPAAFWAHLVLAVGVLPLITAAMQHFVPVLTRSRGPGRWTAQLPWLMGAAGVLAALTLLGVLGWAWIGVAASLGLGGSAGMLAWMRGRARGSLGSPHPGLAWYVAAMGCLASGLGAVALMPWLPGWHLPLRAFHLHINLYGFVGLTAVGTLQVLMPTVAGKPDPEAALRLRHDLKWAVGGSVLLALGQALEQVPVAVAGMLLWGWPLLRMGLAWGRLYSDRLISLHGHEPVLAAALFGFMAALLADLAGRAEAAPLAIFLPGFLFPLVSGAAGQLAPVWMRPGRASPWHEASRRALGRFGGVRAMLFATAALLPLFGYKCAGIPGLLALLWFGTLFAIWLARDDSAVPDQVARN